MALKAPEPVKIDKFIKKYLAQARAEKRQRTYLRDCTTLRVHFLGFIREREVTNLSQLDQALLDQYKVARAEHVAKNTVNRELDTIKAALGKAYQWGMIQDNVAAKVKKFKIPKDTKVKYWAQHEVDTILTAAGHEPGWFYFMVLTALLAGLRRSELCFLTWDRVRLDRGVIEIEADEATGEHTKTGHARQVPMTQRLKEELLVWNDAGLSLGVNGPYVFGTDQPRDPVWSSKVLRVFLKGVGLWRRGVGWHSFRHTFATHLAMSGCPLPVLASYLGHTLERTTALYASVVPDLRRSFIERLDDVF